MDYLSGLVGIFNNSHANNVRFNPLTISDGLPSQSVTQIFQQRNGFVWFATDRGASRYDGNSFRHFLYAPGMPNHITNNFVVQIFEDKQGNVWILTEDGLNKINPSGDTEYFRHEASKLNSINSNWMHYIYQDSNNRIWISTNLGLNLYHPKTNGFSSFIGIIKGTTYTIPINSIIETSEDNFLLATLEGLAFFNASDSSFTLESEQKADVPDWYKDTLSTFTRSSIGKIKRHFS